MLGSALTVLHLASRTEPEWAQRVCLDLPALLVDHAHLERKAASAALALLAKYPYHPELVEPLAELAREELAHFSLVVEVCKARGVTIGAQRAAPYAARLHASIRAYEPDRLLDTLLVCALIEARSCERMRLLAVELRARAEPRLGDLYDELVASEARHHSTYLELARAVCGRGAADVRLVELAAAEAAILARGTGSARMHD